MIKNLDQICHNLQNNQYLKKQNNNNVRTYYNN